MRTGLYDTADAIRNVLSPGKSAPVAAKILKASFLNALIVQPNSLTSS